MRLRMLNGINIFKPNQFQRHLADPYKVENQQKNKIKMKKIQKLHYGILVYQTRLNRYHGSNIFSNISIISASKFGSYKKVLSKLNYNQTQISAPN